MTVLTEAYNFTLVPPRTVRPEPNVMVRYCDNYGLSDMTRPLDHPLNAERLALLDGWAQRSKQLGIWDYWRTIEQNPPGLLAPSSNVWAMHRDIRLFRERGVRLFGVEMEDFMGMGGIMSDWGSNDLQSFLPLRAWLGMKLADNPDRDLDAALTTFFRGYYGDAARPMRELLDVIEERQTKITVNSSDRRRHVWVSALCDTQFFADSYRFLTAAMQATANNRAAQTRVRRERIVIDSAYLWREAAVRREANGSGERLGVSPPSSSDPAIRETTRRSNALPLATARADVLARHREDWREYVASVFDAEGQKLVAAALEPGMQVLEKLRPEDTDSDREAVAVTETDFTLDGQLTESFWMTARPIRLLPRDPKLPNDDASAIRFAWTPDALVVGIEQPAATASATWEVSLAASDLRGIQAELFASANGTVSPYFYRYPPEGMTAVTGRKSGSRVVSTRTDTTVTAECRIPWTDIDAKPAANAEFLVNVGSFPKPDSKQATHVSSPALIGTAPAYHPMYHATVRLAKPPPFDRDKLGRMHRLDDTGERRARSLRLARRTMRSTASEPTSGLPGG